MARYIGKSRVIYDKQRDEFRLELRRNDETEWGCAMIADCRPDKSGETNLIHYGILTELLKSVSNGFELIN